MKRAEIAIFRSAVSNLNLSFSLHPLSPFSLLPHFFLKIPRNSTVVFYVWQTTGGRSIKGIGIIADNRTNVFTEFSASYSNVIWLPDVVGIFTLCISNCAPARFLHLTRNELSVSRIVRWYARTHRMLARSTFHLVYNSSHLPHIFSGMGNLVTDLFPSTTVVLSSMHLVSHLVESMRKKEHLVSTKRREKWRGSLEK